MAKALHRQAGQGMTEYIIVLESFYLCGFPEVGV